MLLVLNLLSVLMREQIIEGNASDHALFCKYAAELLERVTGKFPGYVLCCPVLV